jgi:hypothetical protein
MAGFEGEPLAKDRRTVGDLGPFVDQDIVWAIGSPDEIECCLYVQSA